MNYIYVAGALLAWSALAFVYRWVEKRGGNRYGMSIAMGWSQVALAVASALCLGLELWSERGDYAGVGACQGVIQVILIPVFMAAVARGDLSITWTLLTLSFSMASVMAMVYPGERPEPLGWAGLTLAAVAVAMLGLDMVHRSRGPAHRQPRSGWLLLMAVSFVLNALAMYAYTAAKARSPEASLSEKMSFLVAAGGVFGLGGLVMLVIRRQWAGMKAGLLGGLIGGTLTFVGAFSTLQALSLGVPGHVVYPATTGGSNILVVVLSVVLLKERPGRAGWAGIAAGLAALVLFGLAT